MNRKLRKRLEMAASVVEFQRSNPFTDKSQVAIAAQFAKKREEGDALARAEHREVLAARAAVRDAQELRRGLEHLLPSLASIGAFALRGDAQAMGRFTAPAANKNRAVFVTETASLVDAAREHQDALARHGFTKAQLNDVASRLQQFKNATTAATNAQQRVRETRAKLTRALAELSELLRLLDAFHRVRLERDPELLQVWTALRTVSSAATRSKRSAPAGAAAPNTPPNTPPSTPPRTQQNTAHAQQSAQQNARPSTPPGAPQTTPTPTAPQDPAATPPTPPDGDPGAPPTQNPNAAA